MNPVHFASSRHDIAVATDRRGLLAGGLALVLPGCATTPRSTVSLSPAACLPPVKASADRVIRTIAGLRPYRDSGFVVRAEALGPKRLVHNYGHGGAGITLSWGTSRLAAALGLPGHSGPVAVIGAGIVGLTTARLVQEAGYPVTVYAAALPPETTSNIAGGQWAPSYYHREDAVTPAWSAQLAAALDYSWRRFQIMVGDDYGIRWITTYSEGGFATGNPYEPASGPAPGTGSPATRLSRHETMYAETGRLLRQQLRDVQVAGGRVQVRSFATPAEIVALPETLVFNCTGLGARALFGDTELRPARGQLAVLLPQPEVQYAYTGRAGYMFPRPDGIVLGGTFELDEERVETDPATIAGIVDGHRRLFEGWRCG